MDSDPENAHCESICDARRERKEASRRCLRAKLRETCDELAEMKEMVDETSAFSLQQEERIIQHEAETRILTETLEQMERQHQECHVQVTTQLHANERKIRKLEREVDELSEELKRKNAEHNRKEVAWKANYEQSYQKIRALHHELHRQKEVALERTAYQKTGTGRLMDEKIRRLESEKRSYLASYRREKEVVEKRDEEIEKLKERLELIEEPKNGETLQEKLIAQREKYKELEKTVRELTMTNVALNKEMSTLQRHNYDKTDQIKHLLSETRKLQANHRRRHQAEPQTSSDPKRMRPAAH